MLQDVGVVLGFRGGAHHTISYGYHYPADSTLRVVVGDTVEWIGAFDFWGHDLTWESEEDQARWGFCGAAESCGDRTAVTFEEADVGVHYYNCEAHLRRGMR